MVVRGNAAWDAGACGLVWVGGVCWYPAPALYACGVDAANGEVTGVGEGGTVVGGAGDRAP